MLTQDEVQSRIDGCEVLIDRKLEIEEVVRVLKDYAMIDRLQSIQGWRRCQQAYRDVLDKSACVSALLDTVNKKKPEIEAQELV